METDDPPTRFELNALEHLLVITPKGGTGVHAFFGYKDLAILAPRKGPLGWRRDLFNDCRFDLRLGEQAGERVAVKVMRIDHFINECDDIFLAEIDIGLVGCHSGGCENE